MSHQYNYRTSFGYLVEQQGYGLYLRRVSKDCEVVEVLTGRGWEPFKAGEWHEPTLLMDTQLAEQLMSELWGSGIRPRKWGAEGELGATKNHLEDERAMRAKLLDWVLAKGRK